MKKIIYSILAACTLAWTTSCGDFDINGDLDGMWHLRTVETLADNSVENVKEQCVYYSIQQNLISVKRLYKDNQPDAPKHKQHIGRFIHKEDSLILHDFPYARVKAEIAYDAIARMGSFISSIKKMVEVVEAEGVKKERKSA